MSRYFPDFGIRQERGVLFVGGPIMGGCICIRSNRSLDLGLGFARLRRDGVIHGIRIFFRKKRDPIGGWDLIRINFEI